MSPGTEPQDSPSTPPGGDEGSVPPPRFPVVGIGASAGGLEALSALIARLNCDSMAYVVVQHLAPDHGSMLPELLGRASAIPVVAAEDGMIVEPNHVYVIPPGASLAIFHQTLHLLATSSGRSPQLPIDYFFRSLADDLGGLAFGVVLSGTGSDGTEGLRAIKAAGGITFVQEPFSAQFDGMPRSAIDAGLADFCLAPDAIGAELMRIAKHPYLGTHGGPAGPAQSQLQKLYVMIRAAHGNDLTYYKPSTIERRVARRMALRKIERLDEYVTFAAAHPEEVTALYKDVLIGVTSFFRDREPFEALETVALPRILERKHAGDPIRVWSAGCATGEEAYSAAICLLEALGDRAHEYAIQVFGTDVDADAIQQARRGSYPESIALDVSPARLERFFTRSDGRYQVNRRVRELVVFAPHNVTRDAPFSKIDLVLCRNVLIYLQPVLQKKVLRAIHYALTPEGMLMLGNSESTGDAADLFSLVDRKSKLFAPKRVASAITYEPPAQHTPRGAPTEHRSASPDARPVPSLQQLADRTVLERYAPPGVLVGEDLQVLQFRGRTGAYLEPAPGVPTTSVLKLARPELRGELRAAIREATTQRAPVRFRASRLAPPGGGSLWVDVMPIGDPQSHGAGTLVLFTETAGTGTDVRPAHGPSAAPGKLEESGGREAQELRRELHATRLDLEATIADLEAANEELQAANEELQSTNEELQSTNEELETSKEELQSGNEEVLTVNDELRSRMAELGQHSDDLTNLLTVLNGAIVIVDARLRIRRASRAAERLLHLPTGENSRSLVQIAPMFASLDVERLVGDVLKQANPVEEDVLFADRRWYRMRVMPYVTAGRVVSGAVIEWLDIDAHRRAAELSRAVNAYADQVLSAVLYPLLIVDERMRAVWANGPYFERFGARPEDTLGNLLQHLGEAQWAHPALRAAVEACLANGATFKDLVLTHTPAAGGSHRMRLTGSPVLGLAGGQRLVLISIEDVDAPPEPRARG